MAASADRDAERRSLRRALWRRSDGPVAEVDPAEIDQLLRMEGALIWLDIQDPSDEDLALLREELAFHELAIEDALTGGQRPKVDDYESYYFMVLYAASCGPLGEPRTHEMNCFWGSNYLVTLHGEPIAEIQTAIDRWSSSAEPGRHGVAYQAYALLDAVIDGYFPVLDSISDRVEQLEDRILDGDRRVIAEIFSLRRELMGLRRVLAPCRDVLNELIRRDVPVFPQALIPYLADAYDHSIRVIDTLDLQRDMLSSAVEIHLTTLSNGLNQTMRTLTALTIMIMAPTLIAGVYGMNFQHMPELGWPLGYPLALALMALAVVTLLAIFKRLDWL